MKTQQHILNLTLDELKELIKRDYNAPSYRADQILKWIYRHHLTDFSSMSDLPKELRSRLSEDFFVLSTENITLRESKDGTIKIHLKFKDGLDAEAVLMPMERPDSIEYTACLSTQSGCPVRCLFCATGQGDFKGNLSSGQIVEELLQLNIILKDKALKSKTKTKAVSRIVFMGMGEPLLNFENTLKAIRIINSRWGFNIGARKITLSTVGIPDKIKMLAKLAPKINLAISLHHPQQEKREEIIPLAKKYPLNEIIKATEEYFKITKREPTLEYLLIRDFNSSLRDADHLAEIAKKIRATVNLITYNPTSVDLKRPSKQAVKAFQKRLERHNVVATIRKSRGEDIEAACGQLRTA